MRSAKNRIWELDFLRGFAIIMVVFDHAMYDFATVFRSWKTSGTFLERLYSFGYNYITGDVRFFWRPAFLFLFFSISGICTVFSKNNFVRGLKVWVVAVLVSLVTFVTEYCFDMTNSFILLGVLHCFALIILIYAAIELALELSIKLVGKIRKKDLSGRAKNIIHSSIMLCVCIAAFIVNSRFNPTLANVMGHAYVSGADGDLAGLFFFKSEWWTGDYFPLFPYIAFFFAGATVAKLIYPKRRSLMPLLDGVWHKPFSVCGRYSLWIYVLCQVCVLLFGDLLSILIMGHPILFS